MAMGQTELGPTQRRTVLAAVAVYVLLLSGADGELTGGISSLGGVQMQEKQFEAQAMQRGEQVPRQRLLSENNKFWAQVEPVSRHDLKRERNEVHYGPTLIADHSRSMLRERDRLLKRQSLSKGMQ